MGRSFELLGLAAFNIFIAMILAVTFISSNAAETHKTLTEANVREFIMEVANISSGQRRDLDAYAITSYFMNHIADGSRFRTVMQYEIPDMPRSERELEMDKMNFISHLLQGTQLVSRYETRVDIDYVRIAADGKRATAMTTSYERGLMPVDDGSGTEQMMPVMGASYCEQAIVLADQSIKMAGAQCTTSISFETGY